MSILSRCDRPASAAVLSLTGAAVALLAGSRTWVTATLDDPVLGHTSVAVSGRQAAAVVPAVALVALAGAVALLLARQVGRRVAGLLLVLAGAAAVAATTTLLRSPQSGVRDAVGRTLGAVGAPDAATSVSGWPWLAVVGGVLVAAGGALATLRAGRWQLPTARYDSPTAVASSPSADPGAAWDALSRGEDPTASSGGDLSE